jgi:hypothetical protein
MNERCLRLSWAAAGWAALATLYWMGMAVLYVLTDFSPFSLLASVAVFMLLFWIRDAARSRPTLSTLALASLSASYTVAACWTFGTMAYIEGHGCALQPETCAGGGIPLFTKVAVGAVILYFGAALLFNRAAGRSRAGAAGDSVRLAGGAEGRQGSGDVF